MNYGIVSLLRKQGDDYAIRILMNDAMLSIVRHRLGISYGNFKASVRQPKRHDTYFKVWDVMHDLQAQAKKIPPSPEQPFSALWRHD